MYDKAILENDGILKSVSECYKNQEMCYKVVDNYPRALEFVPKYYKTQNMCEFSKTKFVPECYMTQQIYNKAVNRWFFLYLILFLIGIKFMKCVTELFL